MNGVVIAFDEPLFRTFAGKQRVRRFQPVSAAWQFFANFLPQLSDARVDFVLDHVFNHLNLIMHKKLASENRYRLHRNRLNFLTRLGLAM